jgi:hypothetical protein
MLVTTKIAMMEQESTAAVAAVALRRVVTMWMRPLCRMWLLVLVLVLVLLLFFVAQLWWLLSTWVSVIVVLVS